MQLKMISRCSNFLDYSNASYQICIFILFYDDVPADVLLDIIFWRELRDEIIAILTQVIHELNV